MTKTPLLHYIYQDVSPNSSVQCYPKNKVQGVISLLFRILRGNFLNEGVI